MKVVSALVTLYASTVLAFPANIPASANGVTFVRLAYNTHGKHRSATGQALAHVTDDQPTQNLAYVIDDEEGPNLVPITDELLFEVSLPEFSARRDKRDPAGVDWESDGCTKSPDYPFGWPYLPACHRHDFGYRNYRKQKRFAQISKAQIDLKFKQDLVYQCSGVSAEDACKALAEVYYLAVRHFGGRDAEKRDGSARLEPENQASVAAYDKAVAACDKAFKDAQEAGQLPVSVNERASGEGMGLCPIR
ncbi:p15-like protein [Drechmeria coniospora]|uniref:p15-like protein n=1 Tax=Drechmeria coniospora TaxID=98403 RepID=A0A151GBI6_DRECN|nr:p15-like protein [Drechmeria coniospora]KYK54411.1 p15-like protein [Drechmeria coniospora]